jgi:hypothetical protein
MELFNKNDISFLPPPAQRLSTHLCVTHSKETEGCMSCVLDATQHGRRVCTLFCIADRRRACNLVKWAELEEAM